MIKLDQIKINVQKEQDLKFHVCKKLKIDKNDIESIIILKKSVDARDKQNVVWVYSLGVCLKNNLENKFKSLKYIYEQKLFCYNKKSIEKRPIVVGFGPAGMFCALALARMGFNPIVIEQGKNVDDREKDVNNFWQNRIVNKYSNVQFGEGGAGTFSDGKLNTNLNNQICKTILNEFVHFGADKDILINSKPHIGSDKLKTVVKNIRQEIISLGGEILFSHKFESFESKNQRLNKVVVLDLINNKTKYFETNHLILALGHSSRNTFEMLYKKNIKIKQKPFAMGVRIEQNQQEINIAQYGEQNVKFLPNADYKLVAHLPNGRSIFTFCMCPGGYVVASSSEDGEIVTNGMSNFARDNNLCNSAMLINVTTDDYQSEHPLAGIYFQQKYEKLAFELGGKNFNAPCQTVGSFLYNTENNSYIECSYKPNVTFTNIKNCLPDFVAESLKIGLVELEKKLKGFANENNLLIAIESRSSSPITILRDENFQTNIKGIYPIGEGAGYAGGIISSAQDGIKVAESIYNQISAVK